MSIFVFLTYLAVGIVFSLPVIRLGEEGKSFYQFCAALALALTAGSSGLRFLTDSSLQLSGLGLALTVLFVVGLLSYSAAMILGHEARPLLIGVALLGLALLVHDASRLHNAASPIPAAGLLHQLNAVGCAWLAGSVMVAMILGHYYLVMPGASTQPLMQAFKFSLCGLVLRWLLVMGVGIAWWVTRPPTPIEPTAFLTEGVFVLQRVLFGLVLPASLGYFTWKTIAMRSTQSATGILYVVVFLTLVGEALSVYLSLATRIPI